MHESTVPDAARAAEYVRRLTAQLRFHQAYVRAWNLRAKLDNVNVSANDKHPDAAKWQTAELDAFNAKVAAKPETSRDAAAQSTLNHELDDIIKAIEQLLAKYKPQELPATASLTLSAAQCTAVADQLVDEQLAPEQVAERVGVGEPAVRAVSAQLAPVLDASAPPPVVTLPGGIRSVPRHVRDTLDLGLTVVIAVATAAAYILPLYTSTWGSSKDIVAALAAGAGGQVVIKWAALPALRSRQLHASAVPDAGGR